MPEEQDHQTYDHNFYLRIYFKIYGGKVIWQCGKMAISNLDLLFM